MTDQNPKNIYSKLQESRLEIQNLKLKKTGKNKYSNFSYFELSDFLPAINASCVKHGLFTQFNITPNKSKDVAVLKVFNASNPEEVLSFISETAEVEIGKKDGKGGAQPIQNLGGKITYMRRYLYMTAFEIAETDIVEKVNRETNNKISPEDEKKIKNSKDFTELVKVCGLLKKKYKAKLISPLFEETKTKLEQKESEA